MSINIVSTLKQLLLLYLGVNLMRATLYLLRRTHREIKFGNTSRQSLLALNLKSIHIFMSISILIHNLPQNLPTLRLPNLLRNYSLLIAWCLCLYDNLFILVKISLIIC